MLEAWRFAFRRLLSFSPEVTVFHNGLVILGDFLIERLGGQATFHCRVFLVRADC